MKLPNRQSVARFDPTPEILSSIQLWVQRTCDHANLQPSSTSRDIYLCADCGYEATATFGHVRWRDHA